MQYSLYDHPRQHQLIAICAKKVLKGKMYYYARNYAACPYSKHLFYYICDVACR